MNSYGLIPAAVLIAIGAAVFQVKQVKEQTRDDWPTAPWVLPFTTTEAIT